MQRNKYWFLFSVDDAISQMYECVALLALPFHFSFVSYSILWVFFCIHTKTICTADFCCCIFHFSVSIHFIFNIFRLFLPFSTISSDSFVSLFFFLWRNKSYEIFAHEHHWLSHGTVNIKPAKYTNILCLIEWLFWCIVKVRQQTKEKTNEKKTSFSNNSDSMI